MESSQVCLTVTVNTLEYSAKESGTATTHKYEEAQTHYPKNTLIKQQSLY